MSAIEQLASLAQVPRLPRPLAQMTAIEKSLALTGAHSEAVALIHAKLPKPAWVVARQLDSVVRDSQRSVYDRINERAQQIIQTLMGGGSGQVDFAIHEFNDAIWSGFLGAEYAVAPLSNAIARGENHDLELQTRIATFQAVTIILQQTAPALQAGAAAPLKSGVDAMWKSVCSAPENRAHPECIARGLSGSLGIAPAVVAGILVGLGAVIALAYVAVKWYELSQFNKRWMALCTKADVDSDTKKWCQATGAPPPAFNPNEFLILLAVLGAAGLFAYAAVAYLPQIVGQVKKARRVAQET